MQRWTSARVSWSVVSGRRWTSSGSGEDVVGRTAVERVLESLPEGRVAATHPLASLDADGSEPLEVVTTTARMDDGEGAADAEQPPVYFANAVGRRKRSVAQVWVTPKFGTGGSASLAAAGNRTPELAIVVNRKQWIDYFPQVDHREDIMRPFEIVQQAAEAPPPVDDGSEEQKETSDRAYRLPLAWNVNAIVHGGGLSGQAGALRLGLARCLEK